MGETLFRCILKRIGDVWNGLKIVSFLACKSGAGLYVRVAEKQPSARRTVMDVRKFVEAKKRLDSLERVLPQYLEREEEAKANQSAAPRNETLFCAMLKTQLETDKIKTRIKEAKEEMEFHAK